MEAGNQRTHIPADLTVLWWDFQKREVFYEKVVLTNFAIITEKKRVLWSLFNKVEGLQASNFFKDRQVLSVNIKKGLRVLILKIICKRILLDCFNDSLLQA